MKRRALALTIPVLLILGLTAGPFPANADDGKVDGQDDCSGKKEKQCGEPKIINLNTATLNELMELREIGTVRARRILEFRRVVGPFRRIEELMAVPGVSRRMFGIFRDRLTVGPSQSSEPSPDKSRKAPS